MSGATLPLLIAAGLRCSVDHEGGLVVDGPDDVIETFAGVISAEKPEIVATVRRWLKCCSVCGASPAKWFASTGDAASWHCDAHPPTPHPRASYAWTDWEGGTEPVDYGPDIIGLLNECLRVGVLPMISASHGGLHIANGEMADFFRLAPLLIRRQGEVEAALRDGHGCFDSPSFTPNPWQWAKRKGSPIY